MCPSSPSLACCCPGWLPAITECVANLNDALDLVQCRNATILLLCAVLFSTLLPAVLQTFVIDKQGKCVMSFNDQMGAEKHVDEALQVIRTLN